MAAEENNIGASRLLGTNGLQQAVDSLTTQITKLTSAINTMSNSGGMNSSTGSGGKATWNVGSNKTATGNGGGATYSGASFSSNSRGNGGGGSFSGGSLSRGSKVATTFSAAAGVASALTSYGNKNMSSNMQMDFYGTQSAIAGGFTGGYGGPARLAEQQAFANNYVATSASDAAQAAYTNAYTFGNSQFNGQANPAFTTGMTQANSFGYASPTLGATGAAQAAQQTYTARSNAMSLALGLGGTIGAGGVKNSMSSIANSIMTRTFGNQSISNKQFNAATSQGGSLAVNLQYMGQQQGWSQNTIQEYQNYLQGQVAAQNSSQHISATQYATLTQQAAKGNKTAMNTLTKATGMGSSMFENQRNLNSTQMTRQTDVLGSLAPAFDKATQAVNDFSAMLTKVMNATGMTGVLGTATGLTTPFSNAASGFSGAFGAASGILGAAKLFGGGSSVLGGIGDLLSGGSKVGSAAKTAANAGTAAQDANGVYKITTLGDEAAAGGGLDLSLGALGAASGLGLGAAAVGVGGHMLTKNIKSKKKKQFANFGVDTASGALAGAAVGSVVPVLGTAVGAGVGAAVGGLIGIFGGGSSGVTSNQSGHSSTVAGASGANAASVIKYAESQLGVPYVWGGETPGKGFDCSGLTQWAFGKAGVKIPRVAADQQKTGTPVNPSNVQPGDLLFQGDPAYHVVMAIGGGKVIEAPHTGSSVNIETLIPSQYSSATRIVGSIGNLGSIASQNSPTQNTLNNQQNMSGGDIGSLGTSEADVVASALAGSIGQLPLTASSTSSGGTAGTAQAGGTPKGNGNNSKASLQAYAKQLLAKYGWSGQWDAFNSIEMAEAGWNYQATNPTSGAYGLAQALPASKYASAGKDWRTNGDTQLLWMMDYIKGRYGSPNSAWSFHQANNWYAAGAWDIDKDQTATVHQGEMIIPAQQAETIRQTLVNNSFNPNVAKNAGSGLTASFGNIYVTLPATFSGTNTEATQIGKMIVNATQEQLRIHNLQTGQ